MSTEQQLLHSECAEDDPKRCGFGSQEQCTNLGKYRRWNGVSIFLWACEEHK